MQLIQFEGRTVAVIAPEDLEALEAKNTKLLELLNVAKCPACDGSGWYAQEYGGVGPDGENDTRECVQVQCQWCDERNALLT